MKKIFIITIVAFILLFAGCSTNSSSSSKKNNFELGAFSGGDEAVEISFIENAPPSKILDQGLQPFSFRILVENNGETNIDENSAYVVLTGFEPSSLGGGDFSKAVPALRGIKKQGTNVLPGGKQQISFENLKYVNSVVSGLVPIKLYANICYPYSTNSMGVICIKGDTTPSIDSKSVICEIEGEKNFANSGAPVQISNLQEFSYGSNSISIQFDIIHKPTSNDANVYQTNTIDSSCNIMGISPSNSNVLTYKDKVKYTIETGLQNINCEGTGTNTNIVNLIDNKYTVSCIIDTLGESEYDKLISFKLDYDYLDRKSIDINVEHIQR